MKITRSKNKEVVRVVKKMKKAEDEWQIKRDLVLKEGKIYMLKNEELRVEII